MDCKICGEETKNSDAICDNCKAIITNMNMRIDGFEI